MVVLYLIGFCLLFLIFTPLFYDVQFVDDEIRVQALHRYRMYHVPLAQIQTIRAETWTLNYVPLPFYQVAWTEAGGVFINRRFRPVVRVEYAQPYRRSTLHKVLFVTPKDSSQFIAEVQRRMEQNSNNT
ncbi:MAG TPA: hypothetical protein VGD69_04570 [Herpetosiphonaceae bacterium]